MEVKLNPNGWHRKLQKYVFRNPPLFSNLCPYFWLTNFCIFVTFILPIVPLIKIFKWLGEGFIMLVDKLSDVLYSSMIEPVVIRKALSMDEDQIIQG